ncbi:unnamed protein product [Peronospora destructor]|uniref:DDHD domain-containing protein n=1 Tax=Peronospora destructor TaxID=86335 RepID=A0AAV0UJ67_9STRA|nr:unnamed protein product [Peronospora destructor]
MGNGVSSEIKIFAKGEMEADLQRLGGTGDANVKQLLEKGYYDVVRLVIRPTRSLYDVDALGPERFQVQELHLNLTHDGITEVRRKDFDVTNERGLRVCCSHWQHFIRDSSTPLVTPCLIYLRSNIGSRLDALRVRDAALMRSFSVIAFDCFAVLQSVETDASVSDVCLYAHSMGAFSAVTNLALRAAGAADKKMQAKL